MSTQADIQAAIDKGDYALLARLAKGTHTIHDDHSIVDDLEDIFVRALGPLVDSGRLDISSGVSFTWLWHGKPKAKVLHTQTKVPSRLPTTQVLLKAYGNRSHPEGGTYWSQHYAHQGTKHSNWRYLRLRLPLLSIMSTNEVGL